MKLEQTYLNIIILKIIIFNTKYSNTEHQIITHTQSTSINRDCLLRPEIIYAKRTRFYNMIIPDRIENAQNCYLPQQKKTTDEKVYRLLQ